MGNARISTEFGQVKAIICRLASGRRWWAAEVILRTAGLGGLAGAWLVGACVHRRVTADPGRPEGAADFLLCLLVVILLSSGLALLIQGRGLFRRVPRPPRPLLP